MRITQARFTRRYNVGQYEHEEYELTAVIEENDKGADVLSKLKDEVAEAYANKPSMNTQSVETGRRTVNKAKSKPSGSDTRF
jgi:hypothetical protein